MREVAKDNEVWVLSYGTPSEKDLFLQHYGSMLRHVEFIDRTQPRWVTFIQLLLLFLKGKSQYWFLYRKKLQAAVTRILESEKIDLVHTCTQALGVLTFHPMVATVTDTHEVTHDLHRRAYENTKNWLRKGLYLFLCRVGRRDEIELTSRFDAVLSTTSRDASVWRKCLPNKGIYIVNNGVDQSFLEYDGAGSIDDAIVFTGKMDHYPNEHGLLRFLDDIFPLILKRRPRAHLYVVGANPSRRLLGRASESVTVTGFVEDVRPYISRGRVFIVPLWIGGGIRGKVLEAMAMKKAIVTTSIGSESIRIFHHQSAIFADQDEEFAEAVVSVLEDPKLARRLGENAYHTVVQHYDWTRKGLLLKRIYRHVLEQKKKDMQSIGRGQTSRSDGA